MDWLNVNANIDSPVIFSFPHSGTLLTDELKSHLVPGGEQQLPNMDWHLNELYDFLYDYEVNIISTAMSRYVVDVNRNPKSQLFGAFSKSLIYDKNTWDECIYLQMPSLADCEQRIEKYYQPYHEALDRTVEQCIEKFGVAYVIDMHSFMGPLKCDVCLGNINGRSSSPEFINQLASAFEKHEFDVEQNNVFIGGFITAKYIDNPQVESIQIELRYTNYIPEVNWETRVMPEIETQQFNEIKAKLKSVLMQAELLKREWSGTPA